MENSQGRRSSSIEASLQKHSSRFVSRCVPRTLVATAIAGILSAAAQAQEAPTTATADNTPLQTVTITGTLLKRVDTETPSPVQVITSEDLKDSGYTNLSDVLRNLSANGSWAGRRKWLVLGDRGSLVAQISWTWALMGPTRGGCGLAMGIVGAGITSCLTKGVG